ncbi:methylated-DNA--protein-cysteine methyltransferase [Jeongeupia sp. HS-3]|uniref:methylated-DNA--[protein]-cysteine S-methyltransferase n=1 Tax=Jeongeupia sp. HS-3 TaxID=1009682 RepID=UPI0018A5CB62|nr:methylated-DNA--[protein]-cysteine S-methyltransferase [Jeongeupia sp. HS-3]BCL74308.1 methylated-DNA--protein-cysteine methyltransferase [Jeongeupia sp. HS-3]
MLNAIEYANYHAIIASPIGPLGLMAADDVLLRLDFLPAAAPLRLPALGVLSDVSRQLAAYFDDAHFRFDLPYRLEGTEHQRRVWRSIATIPTGQVLRYGEIASVLGSSARAVGGACGANPLPLVIPCHRVVAGNGLGGFNARRLGIDWLPIKRYLLGHEGWLR